MADFTFDALDQVPEDLREFAKEQDGKLRVSVVPKAKIDEFRTTNIGLAKERDSLAEQFNRYVKIVGEDPDNFENEISTLRELRKKVDDKELVANSSFDSALEQRTKELKSNLEAKAEQIAKDRDAWKGQASEFERRYKQHLIERAVTDAVLNQKSGARPDALHSIVKEAYEVFRVGTNGQITPYEGDAVMYGSNGDAPMSPIEWLGKLRERMPYFFKESSGGGASGGGSIGNFSAKQLEGLSPVEKMKLARKGVV